MVSGPKENISVTGVVLAELAGNFKDSPLPGEITVVKKIPSKEAKTVVLKTKSVKRIPNLFI